MDLHRMSAEIIVATHNPVVPPGTDRHDRIASRHRLVRVRRSVHTQHPYTQFMRFGKRPFSEECRRYRHAKLLRQVPYLLLGTGNEHSVTDQENRFLRLSQNAGRPFYLLPRNVLRYSVSWEYPGHA